MFKLNEINFYESNDEEIGELTPIDDTNKKIIFDHVSYIRLHCKNKKNIILKHISNFNFSKKTINFKNVLFDTELYDCYINNFKVDKIYVMAMCVDISHPAKVYYVELIFDSFLNCKIKELKFGLNTDSEMEVVIK